jgi:hypothetical protein
MSTESVKDCSASSSNPVMEGPGADSEEKHEPVSDIDTAVADSLTALDLKRPIRDADKRQATNRGTPHYKAFAGGETPFSAVVQMVGFGLGRSKMLYLSTGID